MKKTRRLSALLFGLGLAAAVLAAAAPVGAALGEPAGSGGRGETAAETAGRSTRAGAGYTVREIRSEAVTLREYAAPDGMIFAVAWQGQIHPDLTPLLGSYAGEYQTALQRTPRKPGRRRLQVQADQVTVEKWGHMRNLQGRAYIPALIPPGVKLDEIK